MAKKEPKVENRQLAILKDGKNSPFWNEIKRILEAEKADITYDILNKDDQGLTDKAVSDLIKWHNFLDYVVKLPENCIAALEPRPVEDDAREDGDSNDPYETLEVVRKNIKNER